MTHFKHHLIRLIFWIKTGSQKDGYPPILHRQLIRIRGPAMLMLPARGYGLSIRKTWPLSQVFAFHHLGDVLLYALSIYHPISRIPQ